MMIKKIILKLADKILTKTNSSVRVNDVYLVRMSQEFHDWTYSEGWNLFQERRKKLKKV